MDPQRPNSPGERGPEAAAALGWLTQEHRDVLRECYFRGSSVTQAAHALGIAPGTVKSRTYYALRALRLAIEELRDVE
jgi:RNA polymerase sigma-70 factor (ECF subfamily)